MKRRIFSSLAVMLLAGTSAIATAQPAMHGMAPVFNAFDHNADGILDRSELQTYLERRRLPETFADLWQYTTVDSDGDGGVSLQEWSSALGNELKQRAGNFE